MDDRFVTLASLVVRPHPPAVASVPARPIDAAVSRPELLDLARADLAQELALLRLGALEAFERATADLLTRLADDVLGRALALAPADLAALAARALASFAEAEPVALVVAPSDVALFETALPVRGDASLEAGDLVVEVADGAFESRYAFRVRATVASVATAAVR